MLNAKSEDFYQLVLSKVESYGEVIVAAYLSGCAGMVNMKMVRNKDELDSLFSDVQCYFKPKAIIKVYRADKIKNNFMYVGNNGQMIYSADKIDGYYFYKEPVVLVCEAGLVPDVDGELRKGSY